MRWGGIGERNIQGEWIDVMMRACVRVCARGRCSCSDMSATSSIIYTCMIAYEFFPVVPFGAEGAVVRVLAEGAVHRAQQVLGVKRGGTCMRRGGKEW